MTYRQHVKLFAEARYITDKTCNELDTYIDDRPLVLKKSNEKIKL